MKKRVMIEIENCNACPYSDQVFILGKGVKFRCYKDNKEGKLIENWPSTLIPDWCPLENYKE